MITIRLYRVEDSIFPLFSGYKYHGCLLTAYRFGCLSYGLYPKCLQNSQCKGFTGVSSIGLARFVSIVFHFFGRPGSNPKEKDTRALYSQTAGIIAKTEKALIFSFLFYALRQPVFFYPVFTYYGKAYRLLGYNLYTSIIERTSIQGGNGCQPPLLAISQWRDFPTIQTVRDCYHLWSNVFGSLILPF